MPLRKMLKRVEAIDRVQMCGTKNYKKVKLVGVIYGKTERPSTWMISSAHREG